MPTLRQCSLIAGLTLAASAGPVAAGETGTTCRFSAGPRAGQTQSYADVPGLTPLPVGSLCGDRMGSTGNIITDSQAQGGAPSATSPAATSAASDIHPGLSLKCKFLIGPKAGQVQDSSSIPGVTPVPVGSPCSDGMSSYGNAI